MKSQDRGHGHLRWLVLFALSFASALLWELAMGSCYKQMENTYNLIKDKIIVQEMPGVHVKGKTDAIKMFAVINLVGRGRPETIDDVRKIIGTSAPDLSKVNTDDEEKKYNIQA